jgi:hypothetical protein
MKKILLAFSIVCLFISCETKYYSVLVTNKSKEKTVSYTYNDVSDSLGPNESKTYEVEAYTLPPANIEDENGVASIEMKWDGDTYTFVDVEPIIFNVVNLLPFEIKIKAYNYIWDETNASVELSIRAQEERTDELFIYTEKPKFTATSDYPVKSVEYEWNITDLLDESENSILDDPGKPKKKLSLVIR